MLSHCFEDIEILAMKDACVAAFYHLHTAGIITREQMLIEIVIQQTKQKNDLLESLIQKAMNQSHIPFVGLEVIDEIKAKAKSQDR